MKYVKRVEDTNLWKKQFEDSGKGLGSIDGNYYVVNQSGRGETTALIPPVAQDIIVAKSQIKRKRKVNRRNTKKKIIRRRKGTKKKSRGKKKKNRVRRGRVTKRKRNKRSRK